MHRVLRTFVLLALLIVLLPLPAGAHVAPNDCGNQTRSGAGWFNLYGHGGVGCERAKEVARKWQRYCSRHTCKEGEVVTVDAWPGYRCRYRQSGFETVRVQCESRGDRVVHFHWGS